MYYVCYKQDFKKTAKLTWLAETAKAAFTPAIAVEFDNVISKPVLTKNDDFKQFVNRDSKVSFLLCWLPTSQTSRQNCGWHSV